MNIQKRNNSGILEWLEHMERRGTILALLAVLGMVTGFFGWIYIFSTNAANGRSVLIVEIIVQLLMLVINITCLCKVGYNSFKENFILSMVVTELLAMVGFGIIHLNIMGTTNMVSAGMLYDIMNFFALLFIAMILNCIPVMLDCLIMWLIIKLFGKET